MNTGHDQQTSAHRRRRVVMTRPWSPGLRLAAAALVTGGALVAPLLATATPAAAAVTTATYSYSSNYQSFTVPAGVTTVYAFVDGGSGANGQGSYGAGDGEPGSGVTGDLAVTPGEVLTLWVGGAGQPGGGQGFGNPAHNDFEGGSGGSSYGPGTGNGGGGGGASYLEANGQIMMLAGGGGGGGGSGAYLGYGGGNASPGAYHPAPDPIYPDTYGITDAAAYSGGDGSAGGNPDATNSDNGGAGGDGGNGFYFGGGGGGGGGGYAVCDPVNIGCWSAGGGGDGAGSSFANSGDGGGGGAGGNSFADPSLTGVTFGTSGAAGADTAGQITIQYGGPVSSTTVTSVTGNAHPGQPVTFHAFVYPADGSGTVTFASDGTTISGCANLPFISGGGTDWEAVCTTSSLPLGSNTITATYSGDSAYAGSSGSTTETITKYTTSTTLTASPSNPEANAPVTLTADVNTGDGGGSVAFTVGGTALSGCSAVPLTASGTGYHATCTTSWSQAAIYTVVATYSGDANTDGSAGSLAVNVSGPAPTTTSLSLSRAIVVYGNEQAERVSVTVSSLSGTPGGTVTVSSGSAKVCTITLASGSGSCTLPATELPAPLADLTASYNGSTHFAPSTSGGVALVVDKASSTTALSLSAAKVTYGDEQAEKLSVTVSPQYGGTPAGTVTVKTVTTTVCTITLASGKGSCTLTATQFPIGSTQLAASYNGNADFTSSASSAVTLTVSKVASKTALSLSAPKVTYGDEQAEHVSVAVTSQVGTPGGTVTVKSGTATVCTITLGSGKGSCTLTARQFPPGTAQLTASYNGSANVAASASAAAALTVAKAASKTTLSLSAAKVTYGHEQAEHLTVTVTPQYSGTPGGKVTVKSGTATVCTITLASGKGSCTLTASKLRTGTYTLVAAYPGSSAFTSSTSAGKTLTVVK